MGEPIKILVIGNEDVNREEFINLMISYGEFEGENIKIEKDIFQFDDINISSEQNFEEKISKDSNNNIILLTIDYLKSNSLKELENFYNNNKDKIEKYFNVITALNYDSDNKQVEEIKIKRYAKSNKKQLFNFNLLKTINFERTFKSILTEYGKKYNKKTLILEKEKEKLTKRCKDNIYECKIGFIGSKSGKSTLIESFISGKFNPELLKTSLIKDYSKTISLTPKENIKFFKKEIKEENNKNEKKEEIKELKVKVELYDTPHVETKGGEGMNFVLKVAQSVDIIVYLYDNNNIDTFNDILNFWDKKIHDTLNKETLFYVVENKTENKEQNDLNKKREDLCEVIDADGFFITNAKEYDKVCNLINEILISYFQKINVLEVEDLKKEIENNNNKNEMTKNKKDDSKKKTNDNQNNKKEDTNPKPRKKFCGIF